MYDTPMINCLFCKIAAKKIQSEVVFENDQVLAFLDIKPIALGHTVVIPKIHAGNISDLPEELVGPFFSAVKEVTNQVKNALAPDGFTLGMNYGRCAGQAIDHIHFHIVPRWENDGGTSLHGVVHSPPTEEVSVTAERIRGAV